MEQPRPSWTNARWGSVSREHELVVSRAGEAYDAQARSLKKRGEESTSTERRRKWQRRKARRSRTRVEKENRTNYCANCISGRWWRGTQASNCSWQPPSAFTRARSERRDGAYPLLKPGAGRSSGRGVGLGSTPGTGCEGGGGVAGRIFSGNGLPSISNLSSLASRTSRSSKASAMRSRFSRLLSTIFRAIS
jgi:hypothetical protein